MATRTAKLNIEIGGEQEYKNAVAELNRGTQVLRAEMGKLAEEYRGNENSMEAVRAKSDLLQRQLQQQQDKVQTLRDAVQHAAEKYGEADKRTQSWQTQLLNAERDEIKLQHALDETNKGLNKEGDELTDVSKKTADASQQTSIFAGVLKADLVHDALSAAMTGLKELGEAAIDFGKKVIESYGDLQQALGGSSAVFGEYAETVQKAAEDAYKTMGASETEYLEAANKMGSLFQGSGLTVQRSMELTTEAIQRAADVASIMGIDTSAALEAVTGAAKGNYTMMDNLGVKMDATTLKAYALTQGMGKTWEEMSNAEKAELAMKYFFEHTEQYAGNFEAEARTTISGSIGMLQASVETWVAGLGNSEADIGKLTANVIDSFETVVENTVPIVENVISSLPQIYDSIITTVAERDPELAEKLQNFAEPLGTLLSNFWELGENLLPIVADGIGLITEALGWIIEPLSTVVGWLAEFVGYLSQIDEESIEQTMADYSDFDWGTGGSADYGYGYNAAGDTNWRGGLTWVGEAGPELVDLPKGSRIYSNAESEQLAGTDTSRMEALLERSLTIMQRISDDLSDFEAVRRMA